MIWIARGLAKGAAMEPLVDRVSSRLKAAILIGQDRALIESALRARVPELPIYLIDPPQGYSKGTSENQFMESIVRAAQEIASEGDAVLLTPACASMDQFNSYGDRGDRFHEAVKKVVTHEK